MPVKINLLKNRHTLSEVEYRREAAYFRYAVMAAVFVVIITVAVSVWQFILTRQLNSLESEISKSSKELAGLTSANAKQIYLKSRLKLISDFLDDRSVARQSLQKIFSLSIPGVTVSGVRFDSEGTIDLQATAKDIISLSGLIDYLESENDFFLQVVSRGITRMQDGQYQMDVSLTIPRG